MNRYAVIQPCLKCSDCLDTTCHHPIAPLKELDNASAAADSKSRFGIVWPLNSPSPYHDPNRVPLDCGHPTARERRELGLVNRV